MKKIIILIMLSSTLILFAENIIPPIGTYDISELSDHNCLIRIYIDTDNTNLVIGIDANNNNKIEEDEKITYYAELFRKQIVWVSFYEFGSFTYNTELGYGTFMRSKQGSGIKKLDMFIKNEETKNEE